MQTISKFLTITTFTIFVAATPTLLQDKQVSQDKPDKKAKIHKLLEVTGAANMGKTMMDQMMAQFDKMPGLPAGFAKKFSELAKPKDIVKLIVPIYMKHVEERDIDAILGFFSTDSGKRWLAAQPKIMQASMKVGQEWGRELGARTARELQKGK